MKRILFAAFAAIAFAACQTTKPADPFAVHSELMAANAENIYIAKGRICAGYDNGASVVYTNGGASVLHEGKQHEVNGQASQVEGGAWICQDAATGDFLKIYPCTGVTIGKVGGKTFSMLPETGTKIASQKPE